MNMDLLQPKKKKSASSLTVKTFEFKIEKPTSSLSRPLIQGVQCPDGKYRSTNPPAPVQGQPWPPQRQHRPPPWLPCRAASVAPTPTPSLQYTPVAYEWDFWVQRIRWTSLRDRYVVPGSDMLHNWVRYYKGEAEGK